MLELATVYNVAFVVYSMRAVRDVLIFCCVPNPQLSRSTTSYSLSPIRYSSIHPSIYIQHIRTYKSHILVYASQRARRPGAAQVLPLVFPSRRSPSQHISSSVLLSLSIPRALSLSISLPPRCTQQKV